jgi:hypothetical protein
MLVCSVLMLFGVCADTITWTWFPVAIGLRSTTSASPPAAVDLPGGMSVPMLPVNTIETDVVLPRRRPSKRNGHSSVAVITDGPTTVRHITSARGGPGSVQPSARSARSARSGGPAGGDWADAGESFPPVNTQAKFIVFGGDEGSGLLAGGNGQMLNDL